MIEYRRDTWVKKRRINGSRRMEHGRGDLCKGKNDRAGLRKELRIMEQEEGKTSIENREERD